MRRPALAALLLLAAGCATAPPVPVVPAWDAPAGTSSSVADDERASWEEAVALRATVEKKGEFVDDPALRAYLVAVLNGLLAGPLPAQGPTLDVRVVRSAAQLGLCSPDGVVLISTSTLATLRNEAQLAALLGHELGHITGRHRLVQTRYAALSRSMVERMELSRAHEAEADRYAFDALQRAGYDPRELPRMLVLVEPGKDVAAPVELAAFRSHPFTDERVADLERAAPAAPGQPGSRGDAERYAQAIVDVLPIAALEELDAGQFDRALATIERYQTQRPDSGRGYYLKAEHARRTEPDGRRSPPARRAYERAVELAPDDPDAVKALGFLYHDGGEPERAAPLLERYLRLAPDAADRRLVERYLGRTAP